MLKNKFYIPLFFSLITHLAHTDPLNTAIANVASPNFSFPVPIAITPNGSKAYVGNNGNDSVSIIDVASNTATGTVTNPNFAAPGYIAITPNGLTAYVVNEGYPTSVSIVDVNTDNATGSIDFGYFTLGIPQSMAITSDSLTGYVPGHITYFGTHTIIRVDLTTNTAIDTANDPLSLIHNPVSLAITPDDSKMYIANEGNNTVSILDIASNTVTGNVTGTFSNPKFVAITPDGTKAYVVDDPHTIAVINVATDTVIGTITLPGITDIVAFSPDSTTAYATVPLANTVSIIDVASNTVIGSIHDPFGLLGHPIWISVTPDGAKGFVTDQVGNVTLLEFIPAPLPPSAVQGCKLPMPNDLINVITWSAPLSGETPTEYQIYRDAALTDLVATIPADDPLIYEDHNRNPNITYTYYIISVDAYLDAYSGFSTAASVTVTDFCSFALLPPASIQGCSSKNIFLAQIDFVNKISWTAPLGGITPSSYKIYRDAELTQLVATIPATDPLQYYDHNRNPNITYSYYIVTIDEYGTSSVSIDTRVTESC